MDVLANTYQFVMCTNHREDSLFCRKEQDTKAQCNMGKLAEICIFCQRLSCFFSGKNHKRCATYLAVAVGRGFMAVIYCQIYHSIFKLGLSWSQSNLSVPVSVVPSIPPRSSIQDSDYDHNSDYLANLATVQVCCESCGKTFVQSQLFYCL